ncbi:MAG: hypothetical protein K6U07_06810, partial [Firmicutes bacterium]|nr:hypothetical protein [Bacillota bacterium]
MQDKATADLRPSEFTLSVAPHAAGQRLDAYVAGAVGVSRSKAKQLVLSGHVTLDGKPAKPAQVVRAGQVVRVTLPPPEEPPEPVPEDLPVSVVYEDDDLAVVDKPAGLLTGLGGGWPKNKIVFINKVF